MNTQTRSDAGNKQQSHVFQADVARLLHLMVHSIYSERDIFLRELISNGSDACEKLRYEALANPALVEDNFGFSIVLSTDKEAGVLTVADNGVGMDHDDLVAALGTIANSGTRAFLEKIGGRGAGADEEKEEDGGKAGSPAELIGQFGIGFYSAFMVADRVIVESRRAGSTEAWRWSSDGKGSYTTSPLPLDQAPTRGTRVMLHLNSGSKEYLEPWRLETIVREHSGAVAIPIELREAPNAEARQIADGAALWTKPKSAISRENYIDFYRSLAGQFDEPALTAHWRVEGRHEYTALAFVPGSRPMDMFDPERKGKAKLYVRRVLISQESNLLPGWLRFVRLVVDSADLPLNVSREMIQESPVFGAIKRGVTNRIVQELTKASENEPESFAKIWDNFGAVIKEGLYEDPERRDSIFKFARFASSSNADVKLTLAEYVLGLRPNQTAIYYMTGDDAKRIAASPQLEGFASRGIKVLLLSDPVDAFWISTAVGFEGKPFKSVTQGAADIKLIPLIEGPGEKNAAEPEAPEIAALLAYMKQTLGESVSDVRISDRLSDSPACLVAADAGPDRQLERMLAEHGRAATVSKPILEVNPLHALVAALARKFRDDKDRSFIDDSTWLLHDEARIMDGEGPSDAASFAKRLTRILAKAAQ